MKASLEEKYVKILFEYGNTSLTIKDIAQKNLVDCRKWQANQIQLDSWVVSIIDCIDISKMRFCKYTRKMSDYTTQGKTWNIELLKQVISARHCELFYYRWWILKIK